MIYCMRTRIFFTVNNKDYLLHTDSQGFSFHTEYRGQSRVFFFTRSIADGHGFSFLFFLSRIIELSNFVFTRNIADSHGFFFFSFLVPNYRIIEFLSSHGVSQTVTDFLFFFSCPETCPLSRIIETCPWTH